MTHNKLFSVVFVGAIVILVWTVVQLVAQPAIPPRPFRVIVHQDQPNVTLFVHPVTGTCFVGYYQASVVVVPDDVCAKTPPVVPPIVVSPEQ